MHRNQALCHVTVGDDSVDAILTLQPLFVTNQTWRPVSVA